METRFARRPAAARLRHLTIFSRFLKESLRTASHLARPTPALKFIVALAAIGLFAGIPANALMTPTVPVGATAGSFAVSPSGAATYTIPIVVAPGTNGMQPSLSLVYNSQGGNGLLGVGWALGGLSVIHRCGATIAIDGVKGGVNYDANDKFCLDGERLIAIGNGEYRTEHESFIRVFASGPTADPTFFSVWDKDGGDRGYGSTPDSRIEAQGKSIARVWAISYTRDRNLNMVTYSYEENGADGDYRPTTITYVTNSRAGITTPSSSVTFTYELRTDVAPLYVGGSVIKTLKRLSKVSSSTNGTLVREYRLTYDSGGMLGRSRVLSIQECGTDVVCLPATTLQWSGGNTSFDPALPSMNYGTYPSMTNHLADINGDGCADVVRVDTATQRIWGYISNCNGAFQGPGEHPGYGTYTSMTNHLADINGDGCADVVRVDTATQRIWGYISNCNGTFQGPGEFPGYGTYSSMTADIGDVNGDGCADVVRMDTQSQRIWAYISNCNGTFQGPSEFPGYGTYTSMTNHLADINGDGCADVVRVDTATQRIWGYISNCNGTFQGPGEFPGYGTYTSMVNQIADVNGDGCADVVRMDTQSQRIWSYISNCNGTFQWAGEFPGYGTYTSMTNHLADVNGDGCADAVRLDKNAQTIWTYLSNCDGTFQWEGETNNYGTIPSMTNDLADINGDGLPDVVRLDTQSQTIYSYTRSGPVGNQVLRITNGLGVVTNITYKPLTDSSVYTKDGTAAYPYQDLRAPISVVSQATVSNGIGGNNAATYLYGGLKFHHTAAKSLGFRWLKTTDNTSGVISNTSYIQSNDGTEGMPFYAYTVANGKIIRQEEKTWSAINLGGARRLVQLNTTRETNYELNLPVGGDQVTRVTTTMTYDSFGFPVTTVTDFGDGWRKTVTNAYNHDLTNWRLGQLTQSQVAAESPGVAAQSRVSTFSYNNEGNVASEVMQPGTALALTTTYGYDAFGNRTSKTISGADIVTRTESQVYDANGRFVVSSTNALGHTASFGYDARGLLTSQTDANGLTTTSDYDGFGRKGKEIRPDGTQTTITYNATSSGYSTYAETPGAANLYTFYDILGRQLQTNTTGFGGAWIYQNVQYDALGRVIFKSNPAFNAPSSSGTTLAYDVLGRVTSATAPGAGNRTTTTQYSGLTTTITNPKGQATTTVKNSQGKVVSVADSAGTTSYAYDPFLNLTQVTDAAGNVTTMSYDIRGRKTAMHDPDMGNWSYSYDALSQLKTQTDAKGQLISMNYDKLGRMTSRTTPEGTSVWTYDTATYGIGKLATVTGPGGYQESYIYDPLSRLSSTTTTIAGTNYTVTTSYDSAGRLDTVVYPITGYKVKQVYDPYGFLYQVMRIKPDNAQVLLWQTDTADAFSHVIHETFGNGVMSQRVYDPATVDLLSIQTGSGGANTQNIQNLTYAWDALHNLTSRNDSITSLNETFAYDGVNRLTNATGAVAKSYAYDAIGNITSKSDVGTYSYPASGPSSVRPHAVTAVTGVVNSTYAYDANGNMLTGGGRTLTYTSFNKPQSIAGANGTTTLSYDANYSRIQKVTSARTTAYVGKLFERVTAGTLVEHKHYIYGGKSLVATYTERNNGTQPETRYVHTDHLESVSVITDDNGTVVERLSFDPFGKRRQTNGQDAVSPITSGINRGFTRHEQDDEVALINMNARLYDPMLGRFITSDTVVDSAAGQGLNRYSYVRNNPLSLTDPTGNWSLKKHVKAMVRFVTRPSIQSLSNYFNSMPGGQNKYVRAAAIAVVSYYTFGAAAGAVQASMEATAGACFAEMPFAATVAGGTAAGASAGAASAALNGGSTSDVLRAGLRGGVTGAASAGLFYGANHLAGDWGFAGRMTAKGIAGGLSNEIQGGRFSDGFRYNFSYSGAQEWTDYLARKSGLTAIDPETGKLRTDGLRVSSGTNLSIFASSSMGVEGTGNHFYEGISAVRNFVVDVSKVHDAMNSWSYDWSTGMSRSFGSVWADSLVDVYSFAGMLPAAKYTLDGSKYGSPAWGHAY